MATKGTKPTTRSTQGRAKVKLDVKPSTPPMPAKSETAIAAATALPDAKIQPAKVETPAPKTALPVKVAKPAPVPQPVAKVTPPTPAPEKKAAPAPLPTPAKTVAEVTQRVAETTKATAKNVAAPVAKAAETIVEAAGKAISGTATAATAVAEPTAKIAQKEPQPMTDMKTAAEATATKAQFAFADAGERAKAAMEKNAKLVEEFNDFTKGNIEAVVESGRIAAKGVESLGQEAAEYGRKSFEQATATMKNLAAAKSPTELFKLQSDYFRGAFDAYVAEASKTTEHMLKLAGDAFQPLSNRMAVAADKVKTVA